MNKVLKTAINQYLEKSQKKWDLLLPDLTFAYNTVTSESTEYTPAYMNFDRELAPPGSLHHEVGKRSTTPWNDRLRHIEEALELAGNKMAQSFQKQQKHYNLRRRDCAPTKDDEVLKKQHVLSNKAANFDAKWLRNTRALLLSDARGRRWSLTSRPLVAKFSNIFTCEN